MRFQSIKSWNIKYKIYTVYGFSKNWVTINMNDIKNTVFYTLLSFYITCKGVLNYIFNNLH